MAKRRVAKEPRKAMGKTVPSATERAARDNVEALRSYPLSDQEWNRQSKRLTEFVKLLGRWDAEQRAATKCAKMESKTDRERVA
jgi:negative regulator of replication initiation